MSLKRWHTFDAGNCSLINPVHQLLCARLDVTPAPTIALRELVAHPEAMWRPLIEAGVLLEDDTPEEISIHPAVTLRIQKLGDTYFGFDDSEEFPSPKRLTRDDVLTYRVVLSSLLTHLRKLSAIDGRNPAAPGTFIGVHHIGRKSMADGMVSVWFATALGDPEQAAGCLAMLAQEDAYSQHVVVFPLWPDLPPASLSALIARGVFVADLDPASLSIRWPRELSSSSVPADPEYGLIHEGASWRVHFLGDSFTIPDRTGVVYLARLLNDPSNEWTALEVQRGYRTETPRQAVDQPEDGTEQSDQMENPLRAADGQDMARLRRLLTPLRHQIAEAKRTGDVVGEREARAELAKFLPGANQVIGRDDRSRVYGAAEKARKNVSKQINQALAAIEQSREPVARHIRDHLTLGQSMTYSPTRGEVWHVVFPKS